MNRKLVRKRQTMPPCDNYWYYIVDIDANRIYHIGNDSFNKFEEVKLISTANDKNLIISCSALDEVSIDDFIVDNIGKCTRDFLNCYLNMFSMLLKEVTLQKLEIFLKI